MFVYRFLKITHDKLKSIEKANQSSFEDLRISFNISKIS